MTSVSAQHPARDSTHVACAVLDVEGGQVGKTIEAIGSSVYEVDRIAVIGHSQTSDVASFESIDTMLGSLGADIDWVWLVHSDAIPRPDALGALVAEMQRNDASLVGSKIVGPDGEKLESVGSATDVFGEPYSGLDPEEVDLEQYDVVRDVAAVSGVSTLVRRDLLRGLGGLDPDVPPAAAGQDLSQRARLAGGRVMVVPSSEVMHVRSCEAEVSNWRERAGRFRSMIKVYSFTTLVWMIPLAMAIGFIDGLVRLFLRQPRVIFDHSLAFLWNAFKLPSTLAARSRVRAIRDVRDEELFRYQLPGSVLLRDLGSDIGERLGWVIDSEPGRITAEELESESSRAVPVVIALTLTLLALAARGLLFRPLPASRYTLPLEGDWAGVLTGYAGSWNPAGLGSLQPVHPSVAITAAIQALFGGWTSVTVVVLGASLILGTIGFGRLTSRLGIDGPSRYLASIVLFAGPFAAAIADAGDWAGLVAIGAAPWFVALSIERWPSGWRGRLGRFGSLVVVATILASYAPVAVVFASVAVVAVSAFTGGVGTTSLLTMLLAADLGAFAIAPYLSAIDATAFSESGPAVDLVIGQGAATGLAACALLIAVAGKRSAVRLAGIGVAVTAVGLSAGLFAVSGDVSVGAAVIGTLGTAMIVAAGLSIDLDRSVFESGLQWLALVVSVAIIGSSLLAIGAGRLGLQEDAWNDRMDFVTGLSADPEAVRTLLVGFPESLPGDSRVGNGYSYRLVTGQVPTIAEARLAPLRIGDRSLAGALAIIDGGDVLEPGLLLAPFAIQWVMVIDDVEFADVLSSQLDLTEVPLAEGVRVFRNDRFEPRVTTGAPSWDASYQGAMGPADSTSDVRLADNASVRFGPEWSQDEWANRVSASEGAIVYEPVRMRRGLTIAALAAFLVGALLAVTARDRDPS